MFVLQIPTVLKILIFLSSECWTHEEAKGWRRVHVGADHQVGADQQPPAPSTDKATTSSTTDKAGDEPSTARLSLIDLTTHPDEDQSFGQQIQENKSQEDIGEEVHT